MKICVLSAVNIKHMSLISLYTDYFKKNNLDFDIIYMDKYGVEEEISAKNKYVFNNVIDSSKNKFVKSLQYYKFKNFAIPIIEENKYDYIIVWNDVAIMLFGNYLANNFRGKYSLNIRDYFYQDRPIISKFIGKTIKNADFTTISSKAFKNFLPHSNYYPIHGVNPIIFDNIINDEDTVSKNNASINISFIGNVRFFENNLKLIKAFKEASEFNFSFIGTNSFKFKQYMIDNGYENLTQNINFIDSFPVKDTYKYIKEMDIVNNLYGSKNKALDYAVSIKFYHGVMYGVPIIANRDTFIGELVERNGLGIVIDKIDDNTYHVVKEWYVNLDRVQFKLNCKKFIQEVTLDQNEFYEKLEQVFLKN